jgi:hypothetical protein
MPSGGLAGKSTAHNFAQKYASACVEAIETLSKRIGILFESALVIITAPATRLHTSICMGKLSRI